MRRRGKVGRLMMAGTNGTKFPGVRRHVHESIARVYKDLDVTFESFPDDTVRSDPHAYLAAMDALEPGDIVTVFTPDDTMKRQLVAFLLAIDEDEPALAILPKGATGGDLCFYP